MLEIIDLSKRYGRRRPRRRDVHRPPGRIVGFLGPNGAGKTTTMRCIFGLARPDAARSAGTARRSIATPRLRFGYMPEQRGLYPRMRVGEQLSYFAQQHGLSAARPRTRPPTRWLERLGLGDRARSKLEELSHGNQQRDPARRGARPRPGAARARRAVLAASTRSASRR